MVRVERGVQRHAVILSEAKRILWNLFVQTEMCSNKGTNAHYGMVGKKEGKLDWKLGKVEIIEVAPTSRNSACRSQHEPQSTKSFRLKPQLSYDPLQGDGVCFLFLYT